MDQNALRWFGHIERIEEGRLRLTMWIYMAKVDGVRGKGRSRRRWKDGIREIRKLRGFNLGEREKSARDRDDWNMIVCERKITASVSGD